MSGRETVVWTRYGPPEVLEVRDVEKPIPGEDQILIRVHAANVFPGDAEMRRFQMHPSMWLPIRLYLGVFRPRIKILGQTGTRKGHVVLSVASGR